MKLAQIAYRNISRNRRRSILSGTAIAVATMSIVMLFSFMGGMMDDMKENTLTYRTGHLRIRNREFAKYERLNPSHLVVRNGEDLMGQLENRPEVESLSPRINFIGAYSREDKLYSINGTGVDFKREETFQNTSDYLLAGRLPEAGTAEGLVGLRMAEKLGIDLEDGKEDKITIVTTTAERRKKLFTVTIVGIAGFPMSNLNDGLVYMPLDRVQELLRMPGAYSEILIKIDEDKVPLKPFAEDLRETLPGAGSELQVQTWLEDNMLYGFMSMAEAIYGVMGIFFFLLGSSVIINTTMMVIFERMREIGTLQAMGMKGGELTRLFFLEAFFISLIGAAAGMVLGILFSLIMGHFGINLGTMMEGMDFDISTILYPKLKWGYNIFTFVFSVGIASLTTFLPTRKVAKIEPVEALRAT